MRTFARSVGKAVIEPVVACSGGGAAAAATEVQDRAEEGKTRLGFVTREVLETAEIT